MEGTERASTSLRLEWFAVGPVLLIEAARMSIQPSLVPLLARASPSLFGVCLPGLRLWSALAVVATVVIGGLLARELGGRRKAQVLAALATATMPAVLGTGDILETTTLGIMLWAALALVVVRAGRTGDCRNWLPGGLVLGVGLANKHGIGLFALAIFLGAMVRRGIAARLEPRRRVRSAALPAGWPGVG